MMRGITGSGKSTVSHALISAYQQEGLSVAVHSTDNYFIDQEGHYAFDGTKLSKYHQKNIEAFKHSLCTHTQIVICDNTNLVPWQTKAYTQAAREHGYRVVFVDFALRALKEHLCAQEVSVENPSAHAISKKAILKMIHDYKSNTRFLEKKRDDDGLLSEKYFDFDLCIRVEPMSQSDTNAYVRKELNNIIKNEKEKR